MVGVLEKDAFHGANHEGAHCQRAIYKDNSVRPYTCSYSQPCVAMCTRE